MARRPSLKIASINVERSKHLPLLETFLKAQKPDVLCLQELCQRDISFIEDLIGGHLLYSPMMLHASEVELEPNGLGLVSRFTLQDGTTEPYWGPRVAEPIRFQPNGVAEPESISNSLISATINGFRIGTTHLTVTHKGESTPQQRANAAKLISLAQSQAERAGGLLLCGDFNAPRGRATFDMLAEAFTDGVPAHYTSSIDGNIHKAGNIPFMVDGLFHTPSYKLQNATMHTGVSDHCALTATLSLA